LRDTRFLKMHAALWCEAHLLRLAQADILSELRIVEYLTFDSGTDPDDDVTMYLIASRRGPNGYLILSDSLHTDPREAAIIDTLLSKRPVNG